MDSSPSQARKKRSALLDCIRALAIILVLVYHVAVEYPPPSADVIAQWMGDYGLFGVDLFFPLSGYLITGFLLRCYTAPDIKVFFLRRFFRIVPLYMLALAAFWLASTATGSNADSLGRIWHNALFLTGWSIFHIGREAIPFTITWSLSVEEFAYILIGLGALLLRRRLVLALILLCVVSIGLRWYLTAQGYPQVYFYPPARLDSIAIGGLVAWAGHRGLPVLAPLALGLGISMLTAQLGPVALATSIYVAITCATCIVIRLSETCLPRVQHPVVSSIAAIGFYSYFIYLFHYFNVNAVMIAIERFEIHPPFWGICVAVLAVTYLQAWISFRIFEGPLMGYGRRLEGPPIAPRVSEPT